MYLIQLTKITHKIFYYFSHCIVLMWISLFLCIYIILYQSSFFFIVSRFSAVMSNLLYSGIVGVPTKTELSHSQHINHAPFYIG